MKIKFLLIFATIFMHVVSASAQHWTDSLIKTNQYVKPNNSKYSGSLTSSSLSNLAVNCGESAFALAPSAAPCNGASVTSIVFNNATRTVVSAITTNKPGVIYKYANAGTAPDGTVVDALVTVVSYSNNHDADQSNFRDADTNTVGFEGNLQPSLEQESNLFTSNSSWSGSITYKIQFVASGTSTPKRISIAATTVDNDGSGACGGLKESVTYSNALNQVLTSASTNQIRSGNTFTGPQVVQSGIGIGMDYANAALFLNVSEFNWTYSFATSGACSNGGASEDRFGSLNLSCQVNFGRNFAAVAVSGNVYNDIDGLTDNTVDGAGTNAGGLFANLVDVNGFVVSSATVAANGTYTFPAVVAGAYSIQISTTQGVESNLAPAIALPGGWVTTGEHIGTSAGSDGTNNGLLSLTVTNAAVTNANFGVEQRPVAVNHTAPNQSNFGGTSMVTVPPATFSATDPSSGTVTGIRITAFPSNSTTIEINGIGYSAATFPQNGIIVPTNASGNPTQKILIDPVDGAVTVAIPYVAIDNSSVESSSPATANVPFTIVPTAANGNISGKLFFGGNALRNTLVVLIDGDSNATEVVRTDAGGSYLFNGKDVGKNYVVQPLSSKYSFSPSARVVNLIENASEVNFASAAKPYRPKNDFDGDGKSDAAVFRPSEGNWYVLRSSDEQMSVFRFGLGTDVPVSADFDGDGRTDYAVFRPSEGNWYIWQSASETLRVENFGLANDRLIPSDFDGDGKADVAVYRGGSWYVRRSSDDSFEARNFGLESDTPIAEDFDGDGKTDFSVYRPADGTWFTLFNSSNTFSGVKFGLESDTPVTGDFDGDGRADVAQFRNGHWFMLNSTTAFEASQFGTSKDKSIAGDFDGDGRADVAVYRGGVWQIKNSDNESVRSINFGLPTDILVK